MKIKYLFLAIPLLLATNAHAVDDGANVVGKTKITQNVGMSVSLDIPLINEKGEPSSLGALAKKNHPVAIVPVYFRCAGLCSHTLNDIVQVINNDDLAMGKDFTMAVVSFNPEDNAKLAFEKKENYDKELFEEKESKGWTFLTGEEGNIKKLMDEIGFTYKKDGNEFIHSSVVVVITPDGKISRYFPGLPLNIVEFRRGLVEASDGKIGTVIDKVFHYCFKFDPKRGKYSLAVLNASRILGFFIVLAVVIGFYRLKSKEKQ